MGCTTSKLDDLPAVSLCRDRCNFLDEAIRQRYALSQAHTAYLQSLKRVGRSLETFLEEVGGASSWSSTSPKQSRKKGIRAEDVDVKEASLPHSNSDSGSHLHFQSDSEDEDDSDFHHSEHDSPLHKLSNVAYMGGYQNEDLGSFPGGYLHMNYVKNKGTPSVLYEHKPGNSEILRMGESSSSSSSYPYPYPYSTNNHAHPNYGPYFGSSHPPPAPAASSSNTPPPPPPPKASPWDFLNVFESYDDKYYNPSSRDSKELREEEGIPELEDENFQQKVVKEVLGNQNFMDNSKAVVEDGAGRDQGRESSSMENDEAEYEVHVVDEKVVEDEEKTEDRANAKVLRDVSDVAKEIVIQFDRAFESGIEISNLLEVGRFPHNRKGVTSKMLHMVTPSSSVVSSEPSTSKNVKLSSSMGKNTAAYLEVDKDLAVRAKHLSAILQKLYLWEKKLYDEVKSEEKMRVLHDRKRQKLRRLDERGAEAHKVDSTRSLIRSLSTKIRMAIQVVDKISVTINKIRDEELWPQLKELIKGLSRLYNCMVNCHRRQCQAISEARSFDFIGSGKKLGDDHSDATLQLERELIDLTFRFYSWVSSQKGYVRALNGWLLKCILYEPEETPDGLVPFSPGRIGAPPVFVICNQWSQALERISEKDVVDSMRAFTSGLLRLWEQDKVAMRQRMMENKDLERIVRMDKEDQKIQKEIQALDKKMIMSSGDTYSLSGPVYQSDTSKISVQASLQRIFEAMERFAAESAKAYEELLQRSEEEEEALRLKE